ncbi:MAG: TonB-dependent receptor [Steroidobacteraceae bacterium]|jgi:iron complex outermembrane receptor protein|nr:TonB-dependent receptor [Steroidobacteraceae bacterium]
MTTIRRPAPSIHSPRVRGPLATAAIAAGLAAVPAAPVLAQEAEGGLEEIIVTAQRRAESLMDVPIAISAVNAEAIQKQNVDSVEDVLALVPNVSFVSLGSRDRKEISLRGISNQLNPFVDVRQSAYAFYIDEFNVAAGTSNPEILDLEQIEVLRGPQGTYFGRNAVGGALNVSTRKPDNEWFTEVGLAFSSFDTREAHAIVNVPIVTDKLAIRAVGQKRQTDGWIENINPIGGGNDGEFDHARVTARFTPNERLTWDLSYSYNDGVEGMRVGVPTGFLTATWRAVYYQNRPGNVASPDGVGFYPDNRDRVNFNRPQQVGTQFEYVSSRLQYDFDDITLTAVVGDLQSEIFNFGDVDGGSIDAFYEDLLIDRESRSAELRLASRNPQRIEWSVGAIAGEDSGVQDQSTFHGTQSPLGRPNGFEVTGADADTTSEYWAFFGEAKWNISDQWKLVVGGRYSNEEVRTIGQTRSNTVVTGNNNRRTEFSDFSPRVTLSFAPTDLGLFYATASKGFKAGGPQTTGTVQLRNEFDPEELWNYEVGWKTELLDRRVRLDVSAFYMDWENVQQFIRFQFIDQAGLLRAVTGVDNATSATSKGVEFNVQAAVTDNFRVGGQVGYLDAKYGSYTNALIDGTVIDASGKRLINAPEWTLGANAEYSRKVFGDSDGFVRAEWVHRSEQLSNTFALRYEVFPFISPSYDFVNLRAGITRDNWSVNVFAENVFDENFFSAAYEKAFFSGVQVEPSVRNFGVEFRMRFGGGK